MFVFNLFITSILVYQISAITGGDKTSIDRFPHTVHIRHFNRSMCGGAVINTRFILTAAHCTDDLSAKYMTIRAGSDSKVDGGQIIQVEEIIQHPQYNGLIKDYDIAILKLAEPLEFGDKIKPISLQNSQAEVRAGTTAVISGWGKAQRDDPTSETVLQKVEVEIISSQDCKDHYKDNPVTDRMFCTSAKGKDSCKGDSGGPLVANNKLIGLVSWGRGCGKAKFPGVYTKIAALRSWIDNNTRL